MALLGFNDAWRSEHKAQIYDLGADFARAGATVIRYPWVWSTSTDQDLFDGIAEARAAGLQPILCPYSLSNEFSRNGLPNYLSMLRWLRKRYPGTPIEILNEPNLPLYGGYSAQEYAAIFRTAHSVVDSGPVLMAGGAWSPFQKRSVWLETVGAATTDLSYTLSTHFYPGQRDELTPEQVVQNLLGLYSAAVPGRTMWCTEVGYPGGTLAAIQSNEAKQADWLGRMVDELRRQSIPRICIHRLYDSGNDTTLWGVRREDGTWKPALNAIQP